MKSIVKWPGGKSWLMNEIKIPNYNKYLEPFLGSGAFFFALDPNRSILGDLNSQLIGTYNWIKADATGVKQNLLHVQQEYNSLATDEDKKNYYYKQRQLYNQSIIDGTFNLYNAVEFIFLNKCGFNGLYRVNKKGLFNVPWGKKQKLNLIPDNWDYLVNCLQRATILNSDFKDTLQFAEAGDLILFDPPYDATFTEYQSDGFSAADQEHVAKLFKDLSDRGCYCILTNSNTEFIKSLYTGFNIKEVNVRHSINRDSNHRLATEVIVTNF